MREHVEIEVAVDVIGRVAVGVRLGAAGWGVFVPIENHWCQAGASRRGLKQPCGCCVVFGARLDRDAVDLAVGDRLVHFAEQAAHRGVAVGRRTRLNIAPLHANEHAGDRRVRPYVNEFMTPLPKGMSGIFVISENGDGFIEQTTPCVAPYMEKATRPVDSVLWYLCGTGDSDSTSPN